jgi:hypothetical protein
VSYWIKAFVGLGLILGGLTGFLYSLYELMKTGTCSSGGPYVTVRECPEGTFEKSLLVPGGVITSLTGVAVFAFRGDRPGAPAGGFQLSGLLVFWCGLFIGGGIVSLIADMAVDEPGADWVGIFLAVLFIPMGVAPLLFLWFSRGSRRGKKKPRPLQPAPVTAQAPPTPTSRGAGGDPVDRLRQLGELRDSGVLTEAEFAAAKSRILAEL